MAYFQKQGITSEIIEGFLATFQSYSIKIIVTSQVQLGRDKNDFFLLSLSRDSRAKFLTTGDPDLLSIGKFASTQIVSMKVFIEMFS